MNALAVVRGYGRKRAIAACSVPTALCPARRCSASVLADLPNEGLAVGRARNRASMRGCGELSVVAASLALIVKPRVAEFAAKKMPRRLERDRADIREEQLFVIAREHLDCLFQREPLHSLDVVHRLAHRTSAGLHVPELYDLDPAVYGIEHRAEKAVDGNFMSGFFQHLPFGANKRRLARIEFPLWQYPRLVPPQSHDCDARSRAFPKDNSARGQNRPGGLCWIAHVNVEPEASESR